MTQVPALTEDAVEAAEEAEDGVLKIVWRYGLSAADLLEVQRLLRRPVVATDRVDISQKEGIATMRRGSDSPRVLRLRRDRPGKVA